MIPLNKEKCATVGESADQWMNERNVDGEGGNFPQFNQVGESGKQENQEQEAETVS